MTFEEAREHARKGVKITHEYFTDNEYLTMKGNLMIFEDGVEIFAADFLKGKDYMINGWSLYQETQTQK